MKPNIVLIRGAWAGDSCRSDVIQRLQADGFHVIAPQFPSWACAPGSSCRAGMALHT